MRGDPGVIEYLNHALRHELTAVNQYWLHYRLLDNWGYNGPRQEMAHGVNRGNAACGQAHRTNHIPRWFSQHADTRIPSYWSNREGGGRPRLTSRDGCACAL